MTDADLERLYPWIAWREPMSIVVPGLAVGYGCRYCIAIYGLHGRDVSRLPQSREEFDAHIVQFHSELAP